MNIAEKFIKTNGITFEVERNGKVISEILGVPNHEKATSKPYIGVMEISFLSVGDYLINPHKQRFLVKDIVADYAFQELQQYKVFYLTESEELAAKNQSNATIFNIENAYSSVIGSQQNVTFNCNDSIQKAKQQIEAINSPDKEELKQIISLLEMIINNQLPPQKGLLSKFSSVMERNSWITSTLASTLLSWLTAQI